MIRFQKYFDQNKKNYSTIYDKAGYLPALSCYYQAFLAYRMVV